MIPEYKRDKSNPLNVDTALTEMPEIAELIAKQDNWSQYEQPADFSDIPPEYQKLIPDNVRKNQEDMRIYNMWLTKQ